MNEIKDFEKKIACVKEKSDQIKAVGGQRSQSEQIDQQIDNLDQSYQSLLTTGNQIKVSLTFNCISITIIRNCEHSNQKFSV